MNNIIDSKSPATKGCRIARFVRALGNLKALSTVLKHLRHEGHALETAILIQRGKDFVLAPDFNPVTDAKNLLIRHKIYRPRRAPEPSQAEHYATFGDDSNLIFRETVIQLNNPIAPPTVKTP